MIPLDSAWPLSILNMALLSIILAVAHMASPPRAKYCRDIPDFATPYLDIYPQPSKKHEVGELSIMQQHKGLLQPSRHQHPWLFWNCAWETNSSEEEMGSPVQCTALQTGRDTYERVITHGEARNRERRSISSTKAHVGIYVLIQHGVNDWADSLSEVRRR